MSKENDKEIIIKYCVYCGSVIEKNQVYCPECGKLIVNVSSSKEDFQQKHEKPAIQEKVEISRKCSGCGSIITSPVLEQCPICNTMLEKIPESQKPTPIKMGYIFTNKKLEPEQKFVIKKDTWNLKEGLRIFQSCILTYIIIQFLIYMALMFQVNSGDLSIKADIFTILISQLPEIIFGVYPLWYIYSKNHNFKKLGFSSDFKKFILALLIGIIGVFCLLFINTISSSVISIISDLGIEFFDISTYLEEEYQIIRNADLLWIISLIFLIGLGSISTEVLFRGVFQNSLKEKFGNEISGKITAILITALVYAILFLFLTFPIGIIFFFLNFLVFLFLGTIYEINENIYNSIIASVLYHVLLILLIVLF
ncbi:MAG: CPBP family intramembrane glutamic endopeptidase [Promethearchaeota archaeon]